MVELIPGTDEIIEIRRRTKNKDKLPPYNIVGNGLRSRNGTSVDILEVCLQMNTAEIKLLQFFRTEFTHNIIKKESQPNVITPTYCDEFDKYLATALMKTYPHLEYLDVLRRIKRGKYILNPRLFIPPTGYASMQVLWNTLDDKVKEQPNAVRV